MISIIVSTDKNHIIGQNNMVPWRLKKDLVRLKNLTLGHTVILGRKTYDSMVWYYNKSDRKMPGKTYIIVTRNPDYVPERSENTRVVGSIQEAVDLAKTLGDENILSNGGGEIYRAILPYAQRIYLTEVHTEVAGDARFPEIDMNEWREVSREHHRKDEKNEYDFDMVVLDRK